MKDIISAFNIIPGDVSKLVKMHTHFVQDGSRKKFLIDLVYHVYRSTDESEYRIEINNIENPFSTSFPNVIRNSYESGIENYGIVDLSRDCLHVNMSDVHIYMTKEPKPRDMTIKEIEKKLGYKIRVIGEK